MNNKRIREIEDNEAMNRQLDLISKIVHLRLMREREMMTISKQELEKLK